MKMIILYNVVRCVVTGTEADLSCEKEIEIIVPLVRDILIQNGHAVRTLKTGMRLWENLKRNKKEIELVVNMAEAFGGTNSHEMLVPSMLESLDIPFTGASSHGMHLARDKALTKAIVSQLGIPVPQQCVIRNEKDISSCDIEFPLILKPIREEASMGIRLDSVVHSKKQMKMKAEQLMSDYAQPVVAERFIEGREISVGIVGNGERVRVFKPLEFMFPDTDSPYEKIRSYEYKWGGKKEVMRRAILPRMIARTLKRHSIEVYRATESRDYARIDYRLGSDGVPYLLEVNYNPGIGPNTHGLNNTLTMMASFEGLSFEKLIMEIVTIAANRYNRT